MPETAPNDPVLYDLAVIGGGVNGCGIARDAAGRGARVLLLEARDLASGSSSNSSKLIHGGLRYLEHYEFGLVRESLGEREKLWAIAPHIAWPMRFVLPWVKGLRPKWLLRLGLFLYDHLGKRKHIKAAQSVRLDNHVAGGPLKDEFTSGFIYSDCWVDDARLVVLNARDAANRGANIQTHCKVTALKRSDGHWVISSEKGEFRAASIINAAGPAVLSVIEAGGERPSQSMRLVRGSHIVVRKVFDHDYPYFFQLPDGRIFFAIPYEQDFTLIGTTDADHYGPLDNVSASADEIAYLCGGASRFFKREITPDDVVWSYAGVRPLVADDSGKPEAATRGYKFTLSAADEGAPILSVFGGKLTSYRIVAEEALDKMATRIAALGGRHWSDTEPLPGGDFGIFEADQKIADLRTRYPFLEAAWALRLFRSYGTLAEKFLGDAKELEDCGAHFGHGFTEAELRYLIAEEWAQSADDVLWRRSKLGLHLSEEQQAKLRIYMRGQGANG